jgi:hypothetical protein
MAFFPTSPVDGQRANVGNITYQFSNTANAWNRVGTTVTQLIDGITVNITGNINATGSGQQSFSGRISSGGNIVATGNMFGANLGTNGIINANGNITGGNLISNSAVSASQFLATTQFAVGASQMTAAQIQTSDVQAGNAVSSPYISASNIISGNVISTYLASNTANFSGLLTASAGANVVGTLQASTLSVSGNAIVTGTVNAVGNVSGTYVFGNGAFLTGVVTGSGGTGSRANAVVNSGTLSNGSVSNQSVTIAKGYAIYKITTSGGSWVRIYTSVAARTADSSRSQFTDPQPGAGVIAEVITTGANTVLISPGAIGFNDESPVSNSIPVCIQNLSGSTQNIQVTITYVGLES